MCTKDYSYTVNSTKKIVTIKTRYTTPNNNDHMRNIVLEIIKKSNQLIDYAFIFYMIDYINNVPYNTNAKQLNITLKDIQE